MFERTMTPDEFWGRAEILNNFFLALNPLKRPEVRITDPVTGFRTPGKIVTFGQVSLRRTQHLAIAAADLIQNGRGIAALIVARSVPETVGALVWYESKLQGLIDGADLEAIDKFVSSQAYATRQPHLIERAGTDEVKAVNILTQIDKLARIHKGAREDYDHLSEYVHPNAMGGMMYFSRRENESDTVSFIEEMEHPDEIWTFLLAAIYTMHVIPESLQKLGELADRLIGIEADSRKD
jgi:hypothetical protein